MNMTAIREESLSRSCLCYVQRKDTGLRKDSRGRIVHYSKLFYRPRISEDCRARIDAVAAILFQQVNCISDRIDRPGVAQKGTSPSKDIV